MVVCVRCEIICRSINAIYYVWLRGVWSTDEGSITVPLRIGSTGDIKSAILFILSDTAKSESRDLRNIADIS